MPISRGCWAPCPLGLGAMRCITLRKCPSSISSRVATCRAARTGKGSQENGPQDEDPSPFFEPFLRTFVLGAGAGVICEAVHSLDKLYGLASEVGFQRVAEVLPTVMDRFSPAFVADHITAVCCWGLLYMLEVVAVISFINEFGDAASQTHQEDSMPTTLAKKMLPLKLTPLKALLLSFGTRVPTSLSFSAPQTAALPIGQVSAGGIGIKAEDGITENRTVPSRSIATPTRLLPPKSKVVSGQHLIERRSKELEDRKVFLKNFWYAAALSENVSSKPLGVEILGMKVVLFRGVDGRVRCLNDTCPHRGAPLSEGWTATVMGHDCVVCPYHGWAIDDEGRIRDVPAAEEYGQWPRSPQLDTYAVEEKGGFVWLFFEGSKESRLPSDERPPIPFCPELEDPGWKPVYGEIEFDCGHWGVFENAIDMAHIHYLHSGTFGNQEKPEVMDMHCNSDAYGVTCDFGIHNRPVSALWQATAVESVPVEAKAMLPSTSLIRIKLGLGVEMITFVNTVPISVNKAINRFALVRNFATSDLFDGWANQAMMRILQEDKEMVEKLRPQGVLKEVSVRADLPQIMFRKLRQEYIDMGYGETSG